MKNVLALIGLTLSLNANAVTYTYTGNSYDSFSFGTFWDIYDQFMNISVSFTTDNLIRDFGGDAESLVTSYVFSDGANTLINSGITDLLIVTDGAGNIVQWDLRAVETHAPSSVNPGDIILVDISTEYVLGVNNNDRSTSRVCVTSPFGVCEGWYSQYGSITANPGTWVVTPSEVPIPAAAWLFGSALLGLGALKRKKT